MKPHVWRAFASAAIPAAALAAMQAALWACILFNHAAAPLAFVGWIGAMFIAATVLAIASGATEAISTGRLLTSWAFMAAIGSALIAVAGCGGGWIGWMAALRLSILLATWTCLWTAAAACLRRLGAGWALAIPMTIAMLTAAGPVTLVPAARAVAVPHQPAATSAIALCSPLLGMVQALRPDINLDWTQLPQMYEISGMGQDLPIVLPPWWINAGLYAAIAALLLAARRFNPMARPHPPNPPPAASPPPSAP